jgi:hypothetical protein
MSRLPCCQPGQRGGGRRDDHTRLLFGSAWAALQGYRRERVAVDVERGPSPIRTPPPWPQYCRGFCQTRLKSERPAADRTKYSRPPSHLRAAVAMIATKRTGHGWSPLCSSEERPRRQASESSFPTTRTTGRLTLPGQVYLLLNRQAFTGTHPS